MCYNIIDHLPFLELGTTDGVDFIPLEVFDDASSDPIDIPVTLPFGNTVQSSVHVRSTVCCITTLKTARSTEACICPDLCPVNVILCLVLGGK